MHVEVLPPSVAVESLTSGYAASATMSNENGLHTMEGMFNATVSASNASTQSAYVVSACYFFFAIRHFYLSPLSRLCCKVCPQVPLPVSPAPPTRKGTSKRRLFTILPFTLCVRIHPRSLSQITQIKNCTDLFENC